MTSALPAVLHVRAKWLKESETFVADLVRARSIQRPALAYRWRLNEEREPLPARSLRLDVDFEDPPVLARAPDGLPPVDVVHAHFGWDLPLAAELARVLERPLAVSFHGADASQRLRRPEWVDRYRRLLPGAAAITVAHASLAPGLLELGAPRERVRVVPTGVDLRFWRAAREGRREGTTRLLSVGRLEEKKGHGVLLEALARVVAGGRELELAVVGEGRLRDELESRAHALGLASRVHLLGGLSRQEVRAQMRLADLFVLASHTASDGNREGVPVALKEAQAARLPVLATRHSGVPEAVLDGVSGILVEEGDAAGLAEGLERLLERRSEWRRMGAAGRRHVGSLYQRSAVLAAWGELYRELAR